MVQLNLALLVLDGDNRVFKILPPVPVRSSSTLSLSGVAFLSSTNRVELPGLSVADNSLMKCSLIPTSVNAPESSACRGF